MKAGLFVTENNNPHIQKAIQTLQQQVLRNGYNYIKPVNQYATN